MDKIEKFLRKLSVNEREMFVLLMLQLKRDYKKVPGVKKLQGKKDLYRVRVGVYRIVFAVGKQVKIIRISKRSENTYKRI